MEGYFGDAADVWIKIQVSINNNSEVFDLVSGPGDWDSKQAHTCCLWAFAPNPKISKQWWSSEEHHLHASTAFTVSNMYDGEIQP